MSGVRHLAPLAAVGLAFALGAAAQQSDWTGFGASPELPAPKHYLIPTLNIAPASPWAPGEAPTAAPGLAVSRFAEGLDHPRWLYVLPNGDVLVAETNGPGLEKPKGIRGAFMKSAMKTAGAAAPSANWRRPCTASWATSAGGIERPDGT